MHHLILVRWQKSSVFSWREPLLVISTYKNISFCVTNNTNRHGKGAFFRVSWSNRQLIWLDKFLLIFYIFKSILLPILFLACFPGIYLKYPKRSQIIFGAPCIRSSGLPKSCIFDNPLQEKFRLLTPRKLNKAHWSQFSIKVKSCHDWYQKPLASSL